MYKATEISTEKSDFLSFMTSAHVALCRQVDRESLSQEFLYSEPGILLQVQPGKCPAAYAVVADNTPSLVIETSQFGEAIYLVLDAMDACKAGVFDAIFTGAVDRLDGEVQCISGYPQVFGWT